MQVDFGPFLIAGRSSNASLVIAIYRKTGYIQFATPDTMIKLPLLTDSQDQVSVDLIGIEPTDRVAALDRQKIDDIDQRIYFI